MQPCWDCSTFISIQLLKTSCSPQNYASNVRNQSIKLVFENQIFSNDFCPPTAEPSAPARSGHPGWALLPRKQLGLKPGITMGRGVFREQRTAHLHWQEPGSRRRQMGWANGGPLWGTSACTMHRAADGRLSSVNRFGDGAEPHGWKRNASQTGF